VELNEYQKMALTTDTMKATERGYIYVPLLGLAGECGELLSEFKKAERDGASYRLFPERLREELGDILWYLAIVASRTNHDLEDVAATNLAKCHSRWKGEESAEPRLFDSAFPPGERFPHVMVTSIEGRQVGERWQYILRVNENEVGNPLTDNAHEDDAYGLHDVVHLAFACKLGWSPVLRSLMGRKRKSNPQIDEVEDGGRAKAIEEGLIAYLFSVAKDRNLFEGINQVDYSVLRTARAMTSHLEVSKCTAGEWESAILLGFELWRAATKRRAIKFTVSLASRSVELETVE